MRLVPSGNRAGMSDSDISGDSDAHPLVLALDYRVDDVEKTLSLIRSDQSPLVELGARHAVLYVSTTEPDRVLVTIGLRRRVSVAELLRSPAAFAWFDDCGVNDLPAIFAGEVWEKINLADSADAPNGTEVVVGVVASVADPAQVMVGVHAGLARFAGAGIRKVWVYRAVDDGHEVMTLLEIENAAGAQAWISQPDSAAAWMAHDATGGYPTPFVGKLAATIDLMTA